MQRFEKYKGTKVQRCEGRKGAKVAGSKANVERFVRWFMRVVGVKLSGFPAA